MTTLEIMRSAKELTGFAASLKSEQKNSALLAMAESLEKQTDAILEANEHDIEKAKGNISDVMLDRLRLNEKRILGMCGGIRDIVKLEDPVWREIDSYKREDGLIIRKVSVPLGVVAIIYESRPNVTSDAASLALKSGNVCILRCGKEAHESAYAITKALQDGLENVGLPRKLVQLVDDVTRQSATDLMHGDGYIDLLIPRGGKGLISACVNNATVPCIETGTGICHVYVDEFADVEKALKIIENAKTSRPSVCNAEEVCLINEKILESFVPQLEKRLTECKTPVELRMDEKCLKYSLHGKKAGENDFDTEFLDYILAVKSVKDVDEAIAHISVHSTGHSDAIVTENQANADKFVSLVDSAAVYVNASTRFTDGGEFGFGCEIGISTQKLHARGPMGLRELNTYKFIITGDGHIR